MPEPAIPTVQRTPLRGRGAICQECGKPLPANADPRQRYHPHCAYERVLRRNRKWKRRNRARNAAHQRTHRRRHPEREDCRQRYQAAIRDGRLNPPRRCWLCQTTQAVEAHHPDYAHAYRVVPLCKFCHEKHHQRIEDGETNEWPVECIKPDFTAEGRRWERTIMRGDPASSADSPCGPRADTGSVPSAPVPTRTSGGRQWWQ